MPDIVEYIKCIKEISYVNPYNITAEEDEYYRKIQQEVLKKGRKEAINEIKSFLNQCELERKIYIYSFLVDVMGEANIILDFVELILNESRLSPETKYFLYGQIKYKLFIGKVNSDISVNLAMYKLFQSIVQEFRSNLKQELAWIPEESRNKNRVLIIAEQILNIFHGPTKSAMARAAALMKMGKQVLLLNTAEQMSGEGAVFSYGVRLGNYKEENSTLEYMNWKGTVIPFFQCDRNMPNIEAIECLLNMVKQLKPYYVVSIGGDGIFVSLLNEMLPVLTVGMVPSAIGTSLAKYQTLGRKLKESDREYLQKIGKSDKNVIEHKFTSDLREQQVTLSREAVGIKPDVFVLVTVGGRLEDELTDEFWEMIEQVFDAENIELILLGQFLREQEVLEKHSILRKRLHVMGAVNEVLAYLELCDLYVNPIRTGGGTSCVEAMFKGLPIVTTEKGDVAVNAGNEFVVNDYEEMRNCILRYKGDAEFYKMQTKKAKKRAELLLDTDSAFKEVIKEFSAREGLEFEGDNF